jgi:hypothetical protein
LDRRGKAERNEIQLAKSELDLKATHIDPATSPHIDLHIIVNSESIAIRSEQNSSALFTAIIDDFAEFRWTEREAKRKRSTLPCARLLCNSQCQGEFIHKHEYVRAFEQSHWH